MEASLYLKTFLKFYIYVKTIRRMKNALILMLNLQGDDKFSVYLEYVSGGSIQKLLQEYGPFGEQIIQELHKENLSGIVYLH